MSDAASQIARGEYFPPGKVTPKEFARALVDGRVDNAPPEAVELAGAFFDRMDPTNADLARDAARAVANVLGYEGVGIIEELECRAAYIIERRISRSAVAYDSEICAYLAGRLGEWPHEGGIVSTIECSIESATGQASHPIALPIETHVCSVCGEVGHNKRSCPVNAPPPMGQTELDALLIDLRSRGEALLFVSPNGFEIIPEPFLGQPIAEYPLDGEDEPS